MKSISAICLPLLALIGLRSGKQPIDVSGLTEASAAFDREHVEPFLLQVAGALPSGLSANAATQLARNINGLWLGQTGNWEFAVILYDQKHRLVISGFKDDFSAPDIYFFSTPAVANSIRQQITSYFEAAGIWSGKGLTIRSSRPRIVASATCLRYASTRPPPAAGRLNSGVRHQGEIRGTLRKFRF